MMRGTFLHFFALVIFVTVLLGGWLAIRHPYFISIRSVKIEGNFHRLNPQTVEKSISPYVEKKGFFAVDIQAVKERLLTLPWIGWVSVSRIWPNGLLVHIAEQEAIARWGNDHLLSVKGALFSPALETFPTGLPLLYGPPGQQNYVLQHYQQMNQLLAPLDLKITQIELSERHAWILQLNNGMAILLGRLEPLKRLERFTKVYKQVFVDRGVIADRVDLRYAQGMAVHWKLGSALEDKGIAHDKS